jgi:hypothetical protein
MKIMRRGASANHGTKSVELKIAGMKWNPTVETFDVQFANAATDFSTGARHDYWLRFSPAELASVIERLVAAGAAMEADDFTETFQKALPSLFKLQAMASGLKIAA